MWDAVERAFQSFLRFYRVVILNALPLNALPFQSFLRFYSKCIPAERVFERMPSFQSFLRFYKKRINCGELVIENLFQSFLRFYAPQRPGRSRRGRNN